MSHRTLTCWVAIAALAATSLGCQSMGETKAPKLVEKLDIPNGVPWKGEEEPEPGIPSKVLATWTDGVLQRPGQPAQRGFGGRIFFYEGASEDPTLVDGQLVVYAFDETDREPTDNRPTRRYIFPADQFAKHSSESELGVSYSVWLPWDESGGAATDVSLIARFQPSGGGKLIVSEQSKGRLPGHLGGPKVETKIATKQFTPEIQQASHAMDLPGGPLAAPETEVKRRMETTTIKLPRRGGGTGVTPLP